MDEKENRIPEEEAAGNTEPEIIEEEPEKKEKKKKKEPKPSEEDKLKAELAQEHDRYLRTLAEYDNFRKRSAKERESFYGDVQADTVKKFLPVYDNLSRALRQETADEAYRKGVEMTMNQFREILEKMGVKEIEAVGQPFDPAKHNAVMHIEDPELGEGIVAEEFEKGFLLGDKVIRFSMVKVAN